MKTESIDSVQEEYRLRFEALEDDFDRYDYLLTLSGSLSPMKEEEKSDRLLFRGCRAHIWLKLSMEDGRLGMEADSDVILVRGMLAILCGLVSGRTRKEILESRIDLFEQPLFAEIIPAERQEGMKLLIQEIRNFVEEKNGK